MTASSTTVTPTASGADGIEAVFAAFDHTVATKEHHCYSWMYAELLGRYHCMGSLQHVAAGGQRMRMLEIGYDKGDSAELWMVRPGAGQFVGCQGAVVAVKGFCKSIQVPGGVLCRHQPKTARTLPCWL